MILHANMAILQAKMKTLWSHSPQKQRNYFQDDTKQAQKLRNVNSQLFDEEFDKWMSISNDASMLCMQCSLDGDGGRTTHITYGSPRVWSKMNGNKEYPRKAAGKQINPVGGTADYVPENG